MKPRIQDLTLREKIGQTVIFRHKLLEKITDVEEYFTNNPIGAAWTLGVRKETYRAIETKLGNPELKGRRDDMWINYVNTINQYMRIPAIPVVDAKNGLEPNKFDDHAELPTHGGLGATRDPELAFRYGKHLGEDLHATGFRWLWSPVVDNPGRFYNTRCMSCDFENNQKMLTAFIRGVQSSGVATCAKHFPGPDPYDDRDSHFCSAGYRQSFETWKETQGQEYQTCIDAGVDSIMVGHFTFKAVDDTCVNGALLPSPLSHKIITGLLKEQMGFKGVVLTDDADMKALTAIYPQEKLYVELLRAGIDMVLGPLRLDYIDIVEAAVLNGDLPESRIDDACSRILDMKGKYGLFDEKEIPHPTEAQRETIAESIHAVARDIAAKGLTMTANRTGIVPVDAAKIRRVKIVYVGYSTICYDNLKYVVQEFERHGAQCDIQNGFEASDNETLHQYDLILYATYIGHFAPAGASYFFEEKSKMIRQIMTTCVEKSIGVSFGDTNIFFNYFTAACTFINCYSYNPETMEALVKGIYGELQFTDYNPYPLNPITRTDDVYA